MPECALVCCSCTVIFALVVKLYVRLADQAREKSIHERQTASVAVYPRPTFLVRGWTFLGRAPVPWGAEETYHMIVHYPVYAFWIAAWLVFHLPRDLVRRCVAKRQVVDDDIWRLVTCTTLVMLVTVDRHPAKNLTGQSEPIIELRAPAGTPSVCSDKSINRRARSLVVRMCAGTVLSASTVDGPVCSTSQASRNEVVMFLLYVLLIYWIHPCLHMASERSATEIARKKILMLQPSVNFVHALHSGLLHSPISPAGPLLPTPYVDIQRMISGTQIRPPHRFDSYLERFRFYRFYLATHKHVRSLVSKYALNVNTNDLFAQFVHGIDHYGCYEVYRSLGAVGTGCGVRGWLTLSWWRHIWVRPMHNPFLSERVKDIPLPFYADLYDELRQVDADLANEVVASCSF